LKRHDGSLSWEIQTGVGTSSKFGFHGAHLLARQASTDQDVAADLTSVIVLAN
jgi:hypothetical protein